MRYCLNKDDRQETKIQIKKIYEKPKDLKVVCNRRYVIAPPIKACQKDEGREEIYQGRKPQEYSCIARLSDAEKFSIWQVLLARFSWGSNSIADRAVTEMHFENIKK